MKEYTIKEFIQLLKEQNWNLDRRKSSHLTFKKEGQNNIITVAVHKEEINRPLAKRLLKEAGIKLC